MQPIYSHPGCRQAGSPPTIYLEVTMLAMILWELSQVLHAWLRREGSLFGLLAAWWEIASGQIPVGD